MRASELLNIDLNEMTEKCNNFSDFYIENALLNNDFSKIIDHLKENFNDNEKTFMALYWLNDRVEKMMERNKREVLKNINPN
jgi:hypothetical protein